MTAPTSATPTPAAHTSTLLTGIGELFGHHGESALVIDGARIAWIGAAADAPAADRRVDVAGRAVMPGFVDSHAHLVFAGDRTAEFAARMSGTPYAAGGIRTTVAATRAATTDQLRRNVARLSDELLHAGVTTFECKSGYGLDVDTEQRSLAVAGEFTPETTFLGAHVVPDDGGRAQRSGGGDPRAEGVHPDLGNEAARARDYVDLVCGAMLEACAPLARWIDVFCERGAFDADQARTILSAGRSRGLGLRVHANQLDHGPGVQLAVELDAASADHCTHLTGADVDALADGATVATLLPLAEFSTHSSYPDARRLLDSGATVALATDCNPGSAYSTAMPLAVALAVREMGMTPTEAVHAATAGGARALRRDDIGRIEVGLRADLVVLDAPSHVHLAYRPGVPLVSRVWRSGRPVV